MTVSTTESKISYNGNGVTTEFAFSYPFFAATDLVVIYVAADGTETTWVLDTDYTVDDTHDDPEAPLDFGEGGVITATTAPASGTRLVIYRDLTLTQEVDYISGDAFPAETHERALDRLTMIAQQLQEGLDRSAKLPVTSTADAESLVADIIRIADSADNVDIVATNIADVNTVADDITNVNTVAGISGNVTTVAGVAANVTTVANSITNVNTVATNITNVNTVAGSIANVNTVAGISGDVSVVADYAANVNTVAGSITNVNTVATNVTDVNTVADDIAHVNTVATNIANINTAASNIADIIEVANDLNEAVSEIEVVANNITSVQAVGADIANVNAVAGDLTNIDAVAAEIPNLATKVNKTSATGSAVIPTGTTAQRDGTPQEGYFRRNSELGRWEGYNGSEWSGIGGGATGGGSDEVFVENSQTVTTNYTITVGKNAGSFGPISINSGVTVTVPAGQVWTIV